MKTEWECLPDKDVTWDKTYQELENHCDIRCECGHEYLWINAQGRTQCPECGRVYHVVFHRSIERLKDFPRELPEQQRTGNEMWPPPEPTEPPTVLWKA